MTRVPYMLIVGEKELDNKTVSVRDRAGNDLGGMTIDAFTNLLNKEIS
jgi:threonyl-tRNA synthetase